MPNNDEPEQHRAYDVGYGKPPKHTRFKPGQSGNPKGRGPRVRNLKTVFDAEMASQISATENGKKKKISKRQGIVKQIIKKALEGDLRAAQIVLKEEQKYSAAKSCDNPQPPSPPTSTVPLTEEEAARQYSDALRKAESDE
jgi:hypothetical protein